jgi:hypothetical protein
MRNVDSVLFIFMGSRLKDAEFVVWHARRNNEDINYKGYNL